MSKNYIIRKAQVKDVVELRGLFLDFINYLSALDPYLEPKRNYYPYFQRYFRKYIYARRRLMIVAEQDSRLVAFMTATHKEVSPIFKQRKIGFIEDAFVSKSARRQGINREMLEFTYGWFRDNKISRVELGVGAFNELGKTVWDKHGFETILLMKRKILD